MGLKDAIALRNRLQERNPQHEYEVRAHMDPRVRKRGFGGYWVAIRRSPRIPKGVMRITEVKFGRIDGG